VLKGLAFPTSISVNSIICHFSPLPSDTVNCQLKLAKDDVVKITIGAHIDGYASINAETFVVGASASSPVTGLRADLLAAAYNASEAAIRLAKPGAKNWEITEGLTKVLAEYDGVIKGVTGMLTNQYEQNDLVAKKTIRAFATPEQRHDSSNNYTLEEGDVFGLDIVVTTGEDNKAKASPDIPTTIYGKISATKYELKMKTSRSVFSEISKKAGAFPFTLRVLDDEKRGKLGVGECVQHGLLRAYEVFTMPSPSALTAQVQLTFAISKTGAIRLSPPPSFYSNEVVKPDHEIKHPEIKSLLSRSLKPAKKKSSKKEKVGVNGET